METTLNIRAGNLEKITSAADSLGISCSAMIVALMQKVMAEGAHPVRMGRLVRYQIRTRPGDWRAFHVQLREDEYEYFLDMRKLLKMSVSLILAYAVKRFLINPIKENVTDNYPNQFRNYLIVKEYINNIICWKFIWGYQPPLEHHLL